MSNRTLSLHYNLKVLNWRGGSLTCLDAMQLLASGEVDIDTKMNNVITSIHLHKVIGTSNNLSGIFEWFILLQCLAELLFNFSFDSFDHLLDFLIGLLFVSNAVVGSEQGCCCCCYGDAILRLNVLIYIEMLSVFTCGGGCVVPFRTKTRSIPIIHQKIFR